MQPLPTWLPWVEAVKLVGDVLHALLLGALTSRPTAAKNDALARTGGQDTEL